MKKSKLLKCIYLLAIGILALGFLAILLEKTQLIDLYQKPTQQTENEVRPVNDIDFSPASPTDNENINNKKESGQITEDPTPAEPGAPINVVLTAATQDVPGGPVVVRALLTDISGGSCDIELSKDDEIIKYSQNVVSAGSYYNCGALDIPVDELSAGSWELKVNVTSDDRTGSASQVVEVSL